jgi:hypothetical protein
MKMNPSDPKLLKFRELKSLQMSNTSAEDFLADLKKRKAISEHAYTKLQEELVEAQAMVAEQLEELHLEDASIKEIELAEAKRHLLEVRKDHLTLLAKEGLLPAESLDKLKLELDQEINKLPHA